jgi:hypothetical protein
MLKETPTWRRCLPSGKPKEKNANFERMMVEWRTDREEWKAGRKACEEKMIAEQKAEEELWEADRKAYERRMAERKADQEKMEAER